MELLRIAIEAALKAGKAIMEIYEQEDFQVENKKDNSPLTVADKKANAIINEFLLPTQIPIISEENKQLSFEERKVWSSCWIVDPLDGTKEFIKRNGEFTVNIALVSNGKPVMGVIYAPALEVFYYAMVKEGKAYKSLVNSETDTENIFERAEEISPCSWEGPLKIVSSRSHMNDETLKFIEDLKHKYDREVEIVSKGSSLKFCLVAEGAAHAYPRYAPTMEWDTAAGQAICEAVGLICKFRESGKAITYNREDLLNSHFLVSCER